jgi:hypothetical protein
MSNFHRSRPTQRVRGGGEMMGTSLNLTVKILNIGNPGIHVDIAFWPRGQKDRVGAQPFANRH